MSDVQGANILDLVQKESRSASIAFAAERPSYVSMIERRGHSVVILAFGEGADAHGAAVDVKSGQVTLVSKDTPRAVDWKCVDDCMGDCPNPEDPFTKIAWEAGCRQGCGG